MGRFKRFSHGSRPGRGPHRNQHHGPRHVRPNRPHFRDFRKEAAAQPTLAELIPVAQARGPGHSRIMGKIEYDVRMMLKIADISEDQGLMYLACARELYSDFENTKPATVQAALDNTTARWIERGYKSDMVKRIRNRVEDVYNNLKSQRFDTRPTGPQPGPARQSELEPEPE